MPGFLVYLGHCCRDEGISGAYVIIIRFLAYVQQFYRQELDWSSSRLCGRVKADSMRPFPAATSWHDSVDMDGGGSIIGAPKYRPRYTTVLCQLCLPATD